MHSDWAEEGGQKSTKANVYYVWYSVIIVCDIIWKKAQISEADSGVSVKTFNHEGSGLRNESVSEKIHNIMGLLEITHTHTHTTNRSWMFAP